MSFILAWSKMGTRDPGPPRLWTQDRGAWTQNLKIHHPGIEPGIPGRREIVKQNTA